MSRTLIHHSSPTQDSPVISSGHRFQALIEHSSDGIALITADGSVTYASPSTSRILGYAVEELLGRNVFEFVHPDDVERTKALLAALVEEPGASVTTELRAQHKSGSWRWVEAIGANMLDAPSVGAIVINYRDITERRRSEEELREAHDRLTFWASEIERRNREFFLLGEMGKLLQACFTVEEADHVIGQWVRKLFSECSGALYIVDPAKNLASAVAAWGEGRQGEAVFAPDDCWGLRRGRVHVSAGAAAGMICRHLEPQVPAASLCVPMVGQSETLGVLHLRWDKHDPRILETIQPLAGTVAEQIALSLANLKLRERLREQSIRDPLTGLYNRRYMEETLTRELQRAERQRSSVAVVVFDLDHFKDVNDTHGHEAGDAILTAFGAFLEGRIRKGDIVCRYGGEEFVLILPGASLDVAMARATQLRLGCHHVMVASGGQPIGGLTLSLGVAVFPDHGTTGEALLRAADAALYRAKQQGRDRVEIAAAGE